MANTGKLKTLEDSYKLHQADNPRTSCGPLEADDEVDDEVDDDDDDDEKEEYMPHYKLTRDISDQSIQDLIELFRLSMEKDERDTNRPAKQAQDDTIHGLSKPEDDHQDENGGLSSALHRQLSTALKKEHGILSFIQIYEGKRRPI